MKIAVTDTNIFISLIKAGLLGRLFQIGYQIHTTNHVLGELNDKQRYEAEQHLKQGELIVYTLEPDEINEITHLTLSNGLSFVDKSLFYYSSRSDEYVLLTSDNLLKKTCQKKGIEVHGVLWLFDTFLQLGIASKSELLNGLLTLTKGYHRLPKSECDIRIKAWTV